MSSGNLTVAKLRRFREVLERMPDDGDWEVNDEDGRIVETAILRAFRDDEER